MDRWIARAYKGGVQAAFREIVPPLVEDLLDDVPAAMRALDVGGTPRAGFVGRECLWFPAGFTGG